jgi:hypothetical protein
VTYSDDSLSILVVDPVGRWIGFRVIVWLKYWWVVGTTEIINNFVTKIKDIISSGINLWTLNLRNLNESSRIVYNF